MILNISIKGNILIIHIRFIIFLVCEIVRFINYTAVDFGSGTFLGIGAVLGTGVALRTDADLGADFGAGTGSELFSGTGWINFGCIKSGTYLFNVRNEKSMTGSVSIFFVYH